jgi:hypothetical protein
VPHCLCKHTCKVAAWRCCTLCVSALIQHSKLDDEACKHCVYCSVESCVEEANPDPAPAILCVRRTDCLIGALVLSTCPAFCVCVSKQLAV